MDIRSTNAVWQVFFKFFQPSVLSGTPGGHSAHQQTQQAVKPTDKASHFTFDPNRPVPDGPIRRGMMVDIVV